MITEYQEAIGHIVEAQNIVLRLRRGQTDQIFAALVIADDKLQDAKDQVRGALKYVEKRQLKAWKKQVTP